MHSIKELLERGLYNWTDDNADKEADASSVIRGSNTPLIYDGKFVTDGADHCPRIAIARKMGLPTSHPKTARDLLSHSYGRATEALIKDLILRSKVEGLTTREEEDYKVVLEFEGRPIYSARPDLILLYNDKPYKACEFKSVQSNSTAEAAFITKEPKLGACIQVAVQMHFHDIPEGEIVYALAHWVDGYSFATKTKFKMEPSVATFVCRFNDEGWLTVNGKTTIINREHIEAGILVAYQAWQAGELIEQRPLPMKAFGKPMPYSPCDYCIYGTKNTNVCNRAEGFADGLKLENFKDIVLEAFDMCEKEQA